MRVLLLPALLLSACGTTTTARLKLPPLETVPSVELQRYLGTWYEVASFPQSFQKGCTGTTATYSLREDGKIDVVNRCRLGSLQGEEKVANGRARVVDTTTNARLEVSFFGPFWGAYWIIQLDPDYRYAVVGHPSRDPQPHAGDGPGAVRPDHRPAGRGRLRGGAAGAHRAARGRRGLDESLRDLSGCAALCSSPPGPREWPSPC